MTTDLYETGHPGADDGTWDVQPAPEPELRSTVLLSPEDKELLLTVLRLAQRVLPVSVKESLRDEFIDRVATEARKVSG